MVFSLQFPIEATSPVEAELRALLFASRWAITVGYQSFQVETDSMKALSIVEGCGNRRWEDELQTTMSRLERMSASDMLCMRATGPLTFSRRKRYLG
ncbi:unnamed protein product [Cuscuta epithymum]|uniref:RNase H type-1 domain-containing protein n=1 Tax=Cuscuta epithymum TaxID=186058 RepID=A0AAV0FHZ9_9ASTE|nr:unnamed protein product [Cuscuta epithymum]